MPRDCPYHRCRHRSPGCTCRPLDPSSLSHVNHWTHLPPSLSAVCRSCHDDIGMSWVLWVFYLLPVFPLVPRHLDELLAVLVYQFFLCSYNSTSLVEEKALIREDQAGLPNYMLIRLHEEIKPSSVRFLAPADVQEASFRKNIRTSGDPPKPKNYFIQIVRSQQEKLNLSIADFQKIPASTFLVAIISLISSSAVGVSAAVFFSDQYHPGQSAVLSARISHSRSHFCNPRANRLTVYTRIPHFSSPVKTACATSFYVERTARGAYHITHICFLHPLSAAPSILPHTRFPFFFLVSPVRRH